MLKMTLTRELARYVRNFSYDDFTPQQVQKLKIYFLDWLGSACGGQAQVPVKIMLNLAKDMGGNPESTLIPDGSKSTCLLAALVNGGASHVLEMDDLHRESIFHPAAAIMPGVFAVAEREHASGKALLVAIAAGYEVGIRVAVGVGPDHYKYWHTTGTCGTFGAASGAAKLLNLDEQRMVWALGSAGTQAGGLWEFLVESAMSKQLHPGKASLNGVLAALLAQRDFTGACRILEGDKGFFKATSEDYDASRCLEKLGESSWWERNSLKYYPSCGHTHSAIEAALKAIHYQPMATNEIERIDVYVYKAAVDLLGDVEPTTQYLAKFCIPFCVATAVRYGHVVMDDFNEQRLNDSELIRLMEQISVHVDSTLTSAYPSKWPARIEILRKDKTRLTGEVDYPKGDPENPITEDEAVEKFKHLTQGFLSEDAMGSLVQRVLHLEDLSDVSRLLVFNGQ